MVLRVNIVLCSCPLFSVKKRPNVHVYINDLLKINDFFSRLF